MPTSLCQRLPGKVALALTAFAALAALTVGASPTSADEDFYRPPSPLPTGHHGDVIKTQPSRYNNATATRIMYRSTNAKNRPIAVTGTVIVPNTAWPGPGERPVVAYAPFTAGLGDQCTPSKTIAGEGTPDLSAGLQNSFIDALLAKGFAVAQTDYEGLGTPGEHPYVVRRSEAHAVLDVLRAAQRLEGTNLPKAGPLGIAGYSEGGGAAASAAELAHSYTPELEIKGTYVGAPPADKAVLAKSLDGSMYAGFLFYALSGLDTAYPELDIINRVANDAGKKVFAEARSTCSMDSIAKFPFMKSSSITNDGRPIAAYLAESPYKRIVAENRVGTIKPSMPVLIEHAKTDDVIPYSVGSSLAEDWRGKGADVAFRELPLPLPAMAHAAGMPMAAGNAASWLNDQFTGKANSGCLNLFCPSKELAPIAPGVSRLAG